MKPGITRHRGFAAITAIFLVVVLAALGGFMLTFSNTQQLTAAQDFKGSRAYWAARSGIEWAMVAIPPVPALCPSSSATTIAAPPAPATIDGHAMTITCISNSYVEGGVTRKIYRFEARASTGGAAGGIGYFERSVSASAEF